MLKLTEEILDDLKRLRKDGWTKREAVKELTNSTLTTFNAAAKRDGLEVPIREIFPIHRTGPQQKRAYAMAPETAEEALATLELNVGDLHVRAATMRWRPGSENTTFQ